MSAIFLFILFLAITFFFGWVFSALVLKEKRLEARITLAIILGLGGYAFLLNLAGFFMPITKAFGAILAAMLAFALVGLIALLRRGEFYASPYFSKSKVIILFVAAAIISILAGAVSLRTLADSDMKLGHAPLAATIAAGNFPVLDPSAPDHLVAYHYGPDLLSASWYYLAEIPLWLTYDLQTFIFVALSFLLAFLLAWYITAGRFWTSFVAALLFTYGGGLVWLNGFAGIEPLFRKFILGQEVFAPWRFLHLMSVPKFDSSITMSLNHTIPMGTPVMLASIFFYFQALSPSFSGWRRLTLAALSGIFFGHLALSLETNFLVVIAALFFALSFYFLAPAFFRSRLGPYIQSEKNFIFVTLTVITIGTAIAFSQGGILSTLGTSEESSAIRLVSNFWTSDITDKNILPFRGKFFMEFGIPLLLLPPSLWAFRRDPRVLFLALIAVGAFAAPLIFHYETRPREMERLFSLSTPLFSFLAGLWLGDIISGFNRLGQLVLVRRLATFAVVGVMLTSIIFQALYTVFPAGAIGKFDQPFLAVPPPVKPIDERTYAWIRENTTLADRFFPYSDDFIRLTGRFTPGFFNLGWGYPDELKAYRNIIESCDLSSFRRLGISHVYVLPEMPVNPVSNSITNGIKDFESGCLKRLRANLVHAESGEGEIRSIYRLFDL